MLTVLCSEIRFFAKPQNVGGYRRKITNLLLTKDNIYIVSKKANSFCFDYELYYNRGRFGIRFDKNSSAVEKIFFTEFTNFKKKSNFIEYYPSANRKIEGKKLGNRYDGFCIEYYDTIDEQAKYVGEFEGGRYDGKGEFFSEDGLISLTCNNISHGVPNGNGRIVIGNRYKIEKINIKKIKIC